MAFDLARALSAQAEGKAIPNHPALRDLGPTSIYSPGANRTGAVISQAEARRHGDAYGGGQAIDHVYDAIGLYVDPIASSPYHLERPDGTKLVKERKDGTPPDHEVGPKALYDLLDKPNPFMLYDELFSLFVIDFMLVGNAYWLKWQVNSAGQPLALYRLAPAHVKIVPGPYGPVRYEYQPPGAKNPLKLSPEDILHFRRPNPHSAYYGLGVIQGAGRSMDLELAITDTMASYYENRADPSLIVQSDRRVPRDVFNKLRAQLRARVAGSGKAGELLVLEAGLKAETLSPSARDALFQELSRMSRDRIYAKFRTSPRLFGMTDETAGSDKVSDLRREFDNYTLRPFLDKLEKNITDALASLWDVEYRIDYRQVLPPEEALKVAESIAAAPGVKIREVRRQYAQFGIEESTGDVDLDELVINVPTLELGDNGTNALGEAGPADQPIGSEPGRKPDIKNTVAFGTAKVAGVKALQDAVARAESARKVEGKATPDSRLPGEQRPGDSFASARASDIDGTAAQIAAGLRDATTQLERDLLDHVEGKALKTSDLVSRVKRSAAWTTFRKNVERVLEDGARSAAASGVMHSGLMPEEDVDYDEIAKSVIYRPEGVRAIVSTLRDRVVNRIKAARDADAERHDYEAAVREVVAEWSGSQATTIAETEAVHAYNEATLVAAELSGVTHVFVTDGDDHDEPCVEANGSVWEIKEARERRLEHPRCRRAFLPLASATVT